MVFEPLEGVVVQHLAPQVGVVPSGVLVTPDVHKVTRTVTRRHITEREIRLSQCFDFKSVRVLQWCGRRKRVPLHVKLRGSQYLCESVSLIERFRLLDLGSELSRDRGSSLVVLCVMFKDGLITCPMFVELRRELHEVAGDSGS